MASRFAEIKVSDNVVLRAIEEDDVINGVNVIENPGDASVETYLANIVAQDPVILADNGGVYPDTFWKQSMTIGQSPTYRTKPADIGDLWDAANDRFVGQKGDAPASYVLNDTTGVWEPPVALPTAPTPEGATAEWNEANIRWQITLADGTQQYWDPNTSSFVDI
tara:strand:+ start:163 stop:657 length:495 start_codon:yes stop_codon:yes gene_type:complete